MHIEAAPIMEVLNSLPKQVRANYIRTGITLSQAYLIGLHGPQLCVSLETIQAKRSCYSLIAFVVAATTTAARTVNYKPRGCWALYTGVC